MDPILGPFIDAIDEADAERELELLIQQRALPLATAIATRKLRSTGGGDDTRPGPRDREDVVADAMLTLVERLHAARNGSERSPIESFERYTAAVVHSACAHHIRRRYPGRARLKNRLRYVYSIDSRLAMWTDADGDTMCGLAEWTGRSRDRDASRRLATAIDAAHQSWTALSPRAMAAAIVGVARAAGGPVDFESVVGAIAGVERIAEPSAASAQHVPARDPLPDRVIDDRRALAQVWREVVDLPVRQRIALLLNLRDATGAGLLWLLPILGIASLREIARVLDIAAPEFARIWRDIPLDDAAIADRLGCTRQQVINLRMAARKRLLNRLGVPRHASEPRRRSGANLAAVSASLRNST